MIETTTKGGTYRERGREGVGQNRETEKQTDSVRDSERKGETERGR